MASILVVWCPLDLFKRWMARRTPASLFSGVPSSPQGARPLTNAAVFPPLAFRRRRRHTVGYMPLRPHARKRRSEWKAPLVRSLNGHILSCWPSIRLTFFLYAILPLYFLMLPFKLLYRERPFHGTTGVGSGRYFLAFCAISLPRPPRFCETRKDKYSSQGPHHKREGKSGQTVTAAKKGYHSGIAFPSFIIPAFRL